MQDCPDEMELARFLARTLPAPRIRTLEDHFDLCRDCRRLVFALASPEPALETRLERLRCVGGKRPR